MADTKVYVLGDSLETPSQRLPRAVGPLRDPARAATLSLFLWGGGQLYNGQRTTANWLFLLQIFFFGVLAAAATSWSRVAWWLDLQFRFDTTIPALFALLFLWGAAGWVWGTLQAYQEADRRALEPFTGKEREATAALCSLAVPGWGQYLNGQPRKGAAFQALVLLEGLAWLTLLAAYSGFESLERPENRAVLERALLWAAAAIPLLGLARVLTAYDAFKVARYPGLRRNPWLRMKFAWTRYRTGMARQLPSAKRRIRALVLILLLVAADLVAIFYSPRSFYVGQAAWLAQHLRNKGMVQVPVLLDALRDRLADR
ncbi:MAG TPA: hypothetical protein VGT06_07495 [Candidatus Methylomirabilis sp.]|jgi:hypothetical protein|nr:hypothetical protein [Candidatus Methylomirabilis sp.]